MTKKQPKSRQDREEELDDKMLDKLQELYGVKEGKKIFADIQARVEDDLERSKNETWHDREERKKQRRIDRWTEHVRGWSLPQLVSMREKVQTDVKRKQKAALNDAKKEEEYLEARAFLDAIETAISDGPSKNIWTQKKGDFAKLVQEEYDSNPEKYAYDKKKATRIIFSHFEFPDYPDWTWEQCYENVKKYH
jgi:hypothetical protein